MFVLSTLFFAQAVGARAGELVFGPQVCQRGTGAPTVFSYAFPAAEPERGYIFKVYNGGLEDTTFEPASSSTVVLNGRQILGPSNFNENVASLEVPVALQAQNSLNVEVRGRPGGALVIKVLPCVVIDSPLEGQIFKGQPVAIAGHLNAPAASVSVNGVAGTVTGSVFSVPGVPLVEGENLLTAVAAAGSCAGNDEIRVILDTRPPAISIDHPPEGFFAKGDVVLAYAVHDDLDPNPTVGVAPAPPYRGEGAYRVVVTATDHAGNHAEAARNFTIDRTPPWIGITAPAPDSITANPMVPVDASYGDTLSGIDPATARLSLDGSDVTALADVTAAGIAFRPAAPLGDGLHRFAVIVRDRAGNESTAQGDFSVDTTPPAITILSPAQGTTVAEPTVTIAGAVDDPASSVTVNGVAVTLSGGNFSLPDLHLEAGTNTVLVEARDSVGNVSSAVLQILCAPERLTAALAVASESVRLGFSTTLTWSTTEATRVVIDPGVGEVAAGGSRLISPTVTTRYVLTAFGADGVARAAATVSVLGAPAPPPEGSFGAGYRDLIPADATLAAYDDQRFSVLTGAVTDHSGLALAGVSVTVSGRPECGTARTNSEGRYSLPVEGGGLLTLTYRKEGYLVAQRQVQVRWNEVAAVETVALVQPDHVGTEIALDGNPGHAFVHRGSEVTDESGRRAATVVIDGDTRAYARTAAGEVDITRFELRATEYETPEALPAALPPASAFTYCVDISASGLERVRFSKPVTVYVDNFLGFAAGTAVPAGSYDFDTSLWTAAEDGRVVTLLDLDGDGAADALDGTGDGLADDLDGDGSLADEAAGLGDATRYPPGGTFWRVRLTHLTPWDFNWAWSFGPNDIPPNPLAPPFLDAGRTCDQKRTLNSYAECQSRIFHEDLPLPGTDLTLHYASSRVPGYRTVINVPASGGSVPPSLESITVKVSIGGRELSAELPPEPNQIATFSWDGKDHLGRLLSGTIPVRASIGFTYPAVYQATREAFRTSFARAGGAGLAATGIKVRRTVTSWRSFDFAVNRDSGGAEFGNGWTISAHHRMASGAPSAVFKGDGTQAPQEAPALTTPYGYAYGDSSNSCPGWLPLVFCHPMGVASDAAGNLYVADQDRHRVVKIDRSGNLTTFAGRGTSGYSGDGGPATLAQLSLPTAVAADAAGNVYIVTTSPTSNWKAYIRKVDRSGIITTVAGSGSPTDATRRGPAREAGLWLNSYVSGALAADAWGNLYTAESNVVRRIGTDGMIEPVVISPAVSDAVAVAVDGTGNLLIADRGRHRVYKYSTTGALSVFAGNGVASETGDGGPAVSAGVPYPRSLTVDPGGNVYIGTDSYWRIRRVDTNGVITSVAGTGSIFGGTGNGSPAVTASVAPEGMAMVADGSLYLANRYFNIIQKVSVPGVREAPMSPGELLYADDNGLGYLFGWDGRHHATADLKTGAVPTRFAYGEEGLASLSDQFGNTVTIERAGGVPTAIVAPDGQVTELEIDASENLRRVRYPDGTGYALTYDAGALLTEELDPRGSRFTHVFDGDGRLTDIFDPEGGHWEWARTVDGQGRVATELSSAEGSVTSYLEKTEWTGAYSSRVTASDGSVSTYSLSANRLGEQHDSSCLEDTAVTYAMDPVQLNRLPVSLTLTAPSGRRKQLGFARKYLDVDGDQYRELIEETTDVNGRKWLARENIVAGTLGLTSPLGRGVQATYDPETLRVQQVAVAGLHATSFGYDSRGRLTSASQGDRTSQLAYDANGYPDFLVTPDGRTFDYTYDAMGRLAAERRPDGGGIVYRYDAAGNLTLLTNPNAVSYGFEHTANSQRSAMDQPLSGTYRYLYDRDRKLREIALPSGRTITNRYTADRLDATETAEGTITYGRDCGGRLRAASRAGEGVAFVYDGSAVTSDTRSGSLGATVGYTYNSDFLPASMTYAGATETISYDSDGLLTNAGGYTVSRNALNGLPVSVSGGAMSLARTINGYGELDGEATSVSGLPAYSWEASRDAAGRVVQRREVIDGVAVTWDYAYDAAGRLVEVRRDEVVVESYTYDANGNRLSAMSVLRGTSAAYTYSAEDHVLAAGSDVYQFDVDGYLAEKTTSERTTAYVYSTLGELLRVELPDGRIVSYVHDPLGRRIAKQVNGATVEKYLWADRTTLLAVYDGSGNLLQRYAYADARVPVSMAAGGAMYYLLTDQVGTLRAVADSSGSLVKRVDYDSFGNIIADSNPGFAVPFGFAGGLHDRDTGLVRFGFRDYDPAIGRFTAKDPIDFAGGDTNLYAYVMNDPVNLVDPLGLWGYDVHHDKTYSWALSEGLTPDQAERLARADDGTDGGYGSWLPLIGDQSRHFNQGGRSCDSRSGWAEKEYLRALEYYRAGNLAAAFGHLGKGLHSLQDIDPHRDWDTGASGTGRHPDWYDSWNDPRNAAARDGTEQKTLEYLRRFISATSGLR